MSNEEKYQSSAEQFMERFKAMSGTREELLQANKLVKKWADEFVANGTSVRVTAFAAILLLQFIDAEEATGKMIL